MLWCSGITWLYRPQGLSQSCCSCDLPNDNPAHYSYLLVKKQLSHFFYLSHILSENSSGHEHMELEEVNNIMLRYPLQTYTVK